MTDDGALSTVTDLPSWYLAMTWMAYASTSEAAPTLSGVPSRSWPNTSWEVAHRSAIGSVIEEFLKSLSGPMAQAKQTMNSPSSPRSPASPIGARDRVHTRWWAFHRRSVRRRAGDSGVLYARSQAADYGRHARVIEMLGLVRHE